MPALYPKAWKNGLIDEVAVVAAEPDDGRPVGEAAQRLAVGGTRRPSGSPWCRDVKRMSDASSARERGHARVDARPGVDVVAAGEEVGPGGGAGGHVAAEHDRVLEVRQVVALEHGDVVVAEEAVDRDEDAGPAPARMYAASAPL